MADRRRNGNQDDRLGPPADGEHGPGDDHLGEHDRDEQYRQWCSGQRLHATTVTAGCDGSVQFT